MKKVTKFTLIGLLVCVLAIGTMFSTMMLSGASNLTPANTYIQYNGQNAVVLGKTGVRTGANTWKVTLGVTNLLQQTVSTKPVEVALVIDASYSMTSNNVSGTNKTRLEVVQEAAVQMINDLYTKATTLGITINVSLSSFNTNAQVNQTMLSITQGNNKQKLINAINAVDTDGNNPFTNLQGGILKGVSTFYKNFGYTYTSSNKSIDINSGSTFNDANSVKLMVVLSDGDANRYFTNNNFGNVQGSSTGSEADPNAQTAGVNAAATVKSKNITIFSIGFAFSNTTLQDVASYVPGSTTDKLYYTATTSVDLSTVFSTITNQIGSPALNDSMGTNLTTSSGTVTGPTGVTIGSNGALLSWTPTAADLAYNHGNFISYTVTLDITNIAAGEYNNQLLNNAASFGVVINGTTCNGNFPQPTCEYKIGTLDVQFKAGATQIATAEPQQKMITDWGTPTFTINTPPATITYGGLTFYYTGSTYDNNAYTVPGTHTQAATVGTHTLIHNYALHNHNVTYAYTGTVPIGAPTAPATIQYAASTSNISVAAAPTLAGYTFSGWSTTNASVTSGKFTMPDTDVAFTGSWTPNTNTAYTVQHFKQNVDGTYNATPDATDNLNGTTGTTAAYTAKTTFTGFTYNSALTTSNNTVGTSFIIKGDGTLIIKLYYERNMHNVSYQYTGTVPSGAPAVPTTASYRFGTTNISVATVPTLAGYTFNGWNTTDVTPAGGKFTMPDSNVVFSGSWTPNGNTAYKVEHYKQNTNGTYNATPDATDNLTGTTGSAAGFTQKTFTGFTFNSAQTTSNNTVSGQYIIKGDGTLVIKLYYALDTHSVSYQYTNTAPAGATVLPTQTLGVSYGTNVTVAGNATAPGYTFSGWMSTLLPTVNAGETFIMPDDDVIFKGSFTPASVGYTVYYLLEDIDGGSFTIGASESKTGTTGTAGSYDRDKTFTGFSMSSVDTSNANPADFTIQGDGSLVINVFYTRNNYIVSYSYSGDVPDTASVCPDFSIVPYGATVTVNPDATATGYTFSGWSTSDVTVTGRQFTMPAGCVTFYGSFTPASVGYKVYYLLEDIDGGSFTIGASESKTGTTGTAGSYDHDKTFTGFSMSSVDTSNANPADFTIQGDGSLVINVFYTRNNYIVSYSYSGDVPDTASVCPDFSIVPYGATVSVNPGATATGYTFSGWSTSDVTVTGGQFTMPAGCVTFYGSFTPATVNYKVDYYLQKLDGSGYELQAADTATLTGLTDAPAFYTAKNYTGYTFKEANSNNTVGGNFIVKADSSLVISVYYDVNVHNVSYTYTNTVPGASTLPATIGVSYGATVTVAGNATAPGYTFGGWASAQTTSTAGQTFTMADSDVAFNGGFTPNQNTAYLVNYYTQNLDGVHYTLAASENKAGTTGTAGSYDTTKTFTGFTFRNAESNLTPNTDFTIAGNGSLVINVYYTRNSYTVTYAYTGTVPTGVTPVNGFTVGASFGANVTILDATYPNTHLFSGWTPTGIGVSTGTFQMPANNVAFTGSFSEAAAGYTVEHYTQNLTGGGFTKVDTIGASGNIGSAAPYAPKTYEGFTFAPSLTTSTNTVGGQFIIKADGSLTIMLYYTRNSYEVSYSYTNTVPGASALPATIGASYGATVTVAANGSAAGYTFSGWSTADATVNGGTFTMPAKNVALSGGFTPNTNTVYKVEHYKQTLAGTYGTTPDDTDNLAGTTGTTAAYTAKTYTGFTYDSSATTSNTGSFIIKGDGTLVIKLFYTRNANYKYNVEYRKDGATGTLLDSKTVNNRTWGQTYNETAIDITGYTAQAPLSQNISIDSDGKTLVFIYKANKHNVTYQLTGTIPAGFNTSVLAGLGATGVEFNTAMTRAGDLTAANYNFTGWTTGDVTVGASGNYTMPDKNVVFTGSFTLMPAWVVYEYTGDVPATAAALPETKYYNAGNGVTIAAAPAAVTGFTFEGWTRNGSAASNFTITAAGEYLIVGNWVRNSHKVTYQYDSSAPATAPAVPTQATVPFEHNVFVDTTIGNITGYTFKGWVPTSGINATDITSGSFSMPNSDVVFTGSWTVNKHNVSYQLTGEIPTGFNTSVLATLGASGVSYGTSMTVAGPLSFTNYEFHGWTSGQVTPSNGGYQMPDGDVVFTGYFTKKIFTVSYVYTGTVPTGAPALPAIASYEVGKDVTVASPIGMMGYVFYGWTSDGVIVTNGKFTMPARNVVFTGRWVQETSSVPSSVPSEPSIPSSTPSSVPSSVPSSTPTSSVVTSSRPIVSINDTSAPLDVIAMGGVENLTATIVIAAFSAIMLAAVVVIGRKTRKVKR